MRKLLSLLRGLPKGGRGGWDVRTELAAAAVDGLSHIDYLLHRAHFKGGGDPPKPIPRPGQEDEMMSGRPTGSEIREMVFGPDSDGPAQ